MGGEIFGGQDPGALGPPDQLKEQAIQAAAIALGRDDSWFAWDDPTGPRPGMPITAARIAVEAAWDHINWATDAEIRDLTGRLAQADRNWEEAIVERNRLRDHVTALEQAARDFLAANADGFSWGVYEQARRRLRAAVDGGETTP
jgi:hypothetical protein